MSSQIQLQPTLVAASATGENYIPHAPIACNGTLRFFEDNTFACEHATAPPGDPRTQTCLNHSMAILIFEILAEKVGHI